MYLSINKDCFNKIEAIKNLKVNNESTSFFIIKENGDELFFQHFMNGEEKKWIHTISSTGQTYSFDGITNDTTFEQLFEMMNLDIEKINFRFFNDEDYNKCRLFITPAAGSIPFIEDFSHRELNAFIEKSKRLLENEDISEEEKNGIINQQTLVNDCVMQIINLISSQYHNPNTIQFTIKTLSMLLNAIPISVIEDEDGWDEISDKLDDNAKTQLSDIIEGFTNVYEHKRIPSIVKVVKNETESIYNINENVFLDEEGNRYFHPKYSVEQITLPWDFKQSNFIPIDKFLEDEDFKDVKREDFIKMN